MKLNNVNLTKDFIAVKTSGDLTRTLLKYRVNALKAGINIKNPNVRSALNR